MDTTSIIKMAKREGVTATKRSDRLSVEVDGENGEQPVELALIFLLVMSTFLEELDIPHETRRRSRTGTHRAIDGIYIKLPML